MSTYKDTRGDAWEVVVNVPMIRKVTAEGIAFSDLFGSDKETFNRILEDPLFASDILWLICEDQAERRQISRHEFETHMTLDTIRDATYAILDAYKDFLGDKKREIVARLLEKAKQREDEMLSQATVTDDQLDEIMDAAAEQVRSGALSFETVERPAATPPS